MSFERVISKYLRDLDHLKKHLSRFLKWFVFDPSLYEKNPMKLF